MGLRPLPTDYQPIVEMLPGVTVDESEQEVPSEEVDDAYKSADQLGLELVTLSLLPESRWKSLLHLDIIKVSHAYSFTWCFVCMTSCEQGNNVKHELFLSVCRRGINL